VLDEMDLEQAVAVPLVGVTAYNLLTLAGGLSPGESFWCIRRLVVWGRPRCRSHTSSELERSSARWVARRRLPSPEQQAAIT